MVKANRGNLDGIQKGLKAMTSHPFGDHTFCNKSWCRFIEEPLSKYKSLPHGRALRDDALQADLVQIFKKYEDQTEKLAQLESTQANENLNNMVASKIPKTHHYSGSESLNFCLQQLLPRKT